MGNASDIVPHPADRHTLFKACKFCHQRGFVWYRTKMGRWVLALPMEGTVGEPEPDRIHYCPVLAERKARAAVHQKSYKPSTWRRGKSPGSYG